MSWHRAIRVVSLLAFAGGIGLLVHRVQRSPEQRELTHYVEVEVPSLLAAEHPIQAKIDRLGQAPGLTPDQARKLLVDEVVPALIKLKKNLGGLNAQTDEVKALNDEYANVTDALIAACRKCVQVIDDPKLPQAEGLKQVREEFQRVRTAYQTWDAHVQAACVRHRLARPEAHQ